MKIPKRLEPLVEHCELHLEVELTGCFEQSAEPVDLGSVILEIDDARAEDAARRLRMER